jgi:hypothetical protein
MRVQPPAALFVAILYETGAHVATLAFPGHLAKVQAIAWIGWAMASAVMLARSGRLRWGVALGAAWAFQLLASHAQIFYATFWMSALFVLSAALYRLVRSRSDRGLWLPNPVAGLALAGLVCAGLSAVQMLPGLEMGRNSNRGEGFDLAMASSHALPAEELWEIALPCFLGDSTGNLAIRGLPLPYLGKWNAPEGREIGERLVSDYVGLAALIFAACGLLGSRARKKWFFAAAAVVGLLISTGEATPLFSWAHRWAPGFNRFRSPAAFMVVAHFSLFALAALGLQREIEILSRRRAPPPRWLASGATIFLLAAASVIVLVTVRTLPTIDGISLREWRKIVSRPEEFRSELRAIASLRAFCHVACYFGVPMAGSCLLAVLFWPLCPAARSCWRKALGWVGLLSFAALSLLDTTTEVRRFLPRDLTARLEEYLFSNWIESAVLHDARGAPLPAVLESGRELSNRPMMRGVRTIHGYHPIVLADYEKVLSAAGGFDSPAAERLFALNYRVVDEGAAPPEGWRVVQRAAGRQVIARSDPIPFARVPRQVEPIGGKWRDLNLEEWRSRIGTPDFDPAQVTFCEDDYRWDVATRSAPERGEQGGERDDERGSQATPVRVRKPPEGEERDGERGNEAIAVRVRMPRPGEFRVRLEGPHAFSGLSSEGFVPCLLPVPAAPGWRVRIEGLSGGTKVDPAAWPRRANGFFLLVPLAPEPDAETVLYYLPLSYRVGRAVTLATVLSFLVLTLLGRTPRRTPRTPSASIPVR